MPFYRDNYWWFDWGGEEYGPYTSKEQALMRMHDYGERD